MKLAKSSQPLAKLFLSISSQEIRNSSRLKTNKFCDPNLHSSYQFHQITKQELSSEIETFEP